VFGALAVAVCCGGPLLIAAVATTSAGTALAAFGWPPLGITVVLVGVVAGGWLWLRRRVGRRVRYRRTRGGDASWLSRSTW